MLNLAIVQIQRAFVTEGQISPEAGLSSKICASDGLSEGQEARKHKICAARRLTNSELYEIAAFLTTGLRRENHLFRSDQQCLGKGLDDRSSFPGDTVRIVVARLFLLQICMNPFT